MIRGRLTPRWSRRRSAVASRVSVALVVAHASRLRARVVRRTLVGKSPRWNRLIDSTRRWPLTDEHVVRLEEFGLDVDLFDEIRLVGPVEPDQLPAVGTVVAGDGRLRSALEAVGPS